MNDLIWIGATVAQRRAQLGLTQAALARLAGLSRATVNALERGTVADLSMGRLPRLLQVVGAQLQPTPRAEPGDAVRDAQALATAAQTASVSYRTVMPPAVLANVLATGKLPADYVAHMATLLDEAPLSVVVAAVEAAAHSTDVEVSGGAGATPAQVWKHVGALARQLKSPRKEWAEF